MTARVTGTGTYRTEEDYRETALDQALIAAPPGAGAREIIALADAFLVYVRGGALS